MPNNLSFHFSTTFFNPHFVFIVSFIYQFLTKMHRHNMFWIYFGILEGRTWETLTFERVRFNSGKKKKKTEQASTVLLLRDIYLLQVLQNLSISQILFLLDFLLDANFPSFSLGQEYINSLHTNCFIIQSLTFGM